MDIETVKVSAAKWNQVLHSAVNQNKGSKGKHIVYDTQKKQFRLGNAKEVGVQTLSVLEIVKISHKLNEGVSITDSQQMISNTKRIIKARELKRDSLTNVMLRWVACAFSIPFLPLAIVVFGHYTDKFEKGQSYLRSRLENASQKELDKEIK